MSVVTTQALLLRAYPYGETSLILRFFSSDMGRVGVMARGARKRGSRGGSGLETFASGALTLYVKSTRDLQTMRDFDPTRSRPGLGGDVVRFGGASLVAELILKHSGEAASHELFENVESALDRIESCDPADRVVTILQEAWGLVVTLGYHPSIDVCVQCGELLDGEELGRFDLAAGGMRCARCAQGTSGPRLGPEGRAQVMGLLTGSSPSLSRPRAHLRLLGDFVTYHLTDQRPLSSFGFLAPLLPPEADAPRDGEGSP